MRIATRGIDHSERNRLVEEHLGLVRAMAYRLAQRLPPQVETPDLISIGVLGLMEAAGRYLPSLGVPFEAFARRRVQGAMLDALRELDWAPRSLRKMRRELDFALGRLRHDLHREPTEEEIAGALQMTTAAYGRALEQLRTLELKVRPIDGPSGEGLLELCFDPDDGPEVRLQRTELRDYLARAIETLPPRERRILTMYYDQEMTMAAIGSVLGVVESRVSQLRSLAIRAAAHVAARDARHHRQPRAGLEGLADAQGETRRLTSAMSARGAVESRALYLPLAEGACSARTLENAKLDALSQVRGSQPTARSRDLAGARLGQPAGDPRPPMRATPRLRRTWRVAGILPLFSVAVLA